jgi:ABC-type lipoprotein export system ATPase subunit
MTETTPETYAIQTKDLWRIYTTGTQEVAALRGINLQLTPGSFIALKGRSGSGKTTLLNCLGGLDRPTRGDVIISGRISQTLMKRK